ncbi:MAG TPA: chemotaxis protein CheB [Lysobacter sp.]|nr:chemotaxis protein CheB [Lysobacter sp.]
MTDARRVALLARPGEACERLRAALREAGGEIVLEADPSTLAAETLSAAAPQTVLVALDPAVEDALERFDAVLGDPGVAVIFDEAELAARREGWDAARWVRHLAAKLHRHGDVLPPGREPDEMVADPAAAQRTFDEIVAGQVPEETIEETARQPMASLETIEEIVMEPPVASDDSFEEIIFETAAETAAPGYSVSDIEEAPAAFSGLSLTDDINEMSLDGDDVALKFEGGLEFDTLLAGLQTEEAPDTQAVPAGLDDFLASTPDVALDMVAELPAIEPAPAIAESTPPAASEPAPAASKPSFDFGALSLVDQDDAPAAAAAPAVAGRFQHDIADLERRIASMGLSDGPDAAVAQTQAAQFEPEAAEPASAPMAKFETARGAVLILAGIGGPDAVRQILSGLPAAFARPVLISQRLDGGRYDRLVQQMARAAALPVQLAQAGATADTGNVYIVPPELGLDATDGLRFAPGAALLASLPADESAVLLLSGADPAHVDDALAKATEGALVAGQSPEGCYDAAAPIALTSRGGSAAAPSELVQRLLQRWPA